MMHPSPRFTQLEQLQDTLGLRQPGSLSLPLPPSPWGFPHLQNSEENGTALDDSEQVLGNL